MIIVTSVDLQSLQITFWRTCLAPGYTGHIFFFFKTSQTSSAGIATPIATVSKEIKQLGKLSQPLCMTADMNCFDGGVLTSISFITLMDIMNQSAISWQRSLRHKSEQTSAQMRHRRLWRRRAVDEQRVRRRSHSLPQSPSLANPLSFMCPTKHPLITLTLNTSP